MKQVSPNAIVVIHPDNSKSLAGLTFFLLFFIIICNVHAQEETKVTSFGIHAGVNTASEAEKFRPGPSLSLHGAYSLFENYIQLELMLFYDGRPDIAVINRDRITAVGLAAGLRANIRPHKNWNPSFVFMQGFTSVKEHDGLFAEAFSHTLCLVFSNTLYQKHMISFGMHAYFPSESKPFRYSQVKILPNIKYGFWF